MQVAKQKAAVTALTGVGKFRVYYIARDAFPQVWCISPSPGWSPVCWELSVCHVTIAVPTRAVFVSDKPVADHVDGEPSAYFEAFGRLTIDDEGHATISDHTK